MRSLMVVIERLSGSAWVLSAIGDNTLRLRSGSTLSVPSLSASRSRPLGVSSSRGVCRPRVGCDAGSWSHTECSAPPGRRQCERSAHIAMFHVEPLTIADGAGAGLLCRRSRARRVMEIILVQLVSVGSVYVERCGKSGSPSRWVICSAPPAFALVRGHPAPIGGPSSSSSEIGAMPSAGPRHESPLGAAGSL